MVIYVDKDFKCHLESNDERMLVDVSFFNDKCSDFIEGYRFVPEGYTWVRADGKTFQGEMLSPWKPYSELDAAQREYERALIEDMRAALEILEVQTDE